MKTTSSILHGYALSGFCLQLALLYQSAIPLNDGLAIMAEDASSPEEKELLLSMSDQLRMGSGLSEVIKNTDIFPPYMQEMVFLGEQTGTLDTTLKGLFSYYEKEAKAAEGLRRALTYPAMMVGMLLIILFVLFSKVMPVFSDVYLQLGAQIPPAAEAAIRAGGMISSLALFILAVLALFMIALKFMLKSGKQSASINAFIDKVRTKSKIQHLTALRRTCSTMSVTMGCGLRIEEGLAIAEKLAENPEVEQKLQQVRCAIVNGQSFSEALKDSRLFNGFDLQLIHAASRAGQLESILAKLADDYDEKCTELLDGMIAKIEPMIVIFLTVSVGLVLFSVMLPLAGVLSAIG